MFDRLDAIVAVCFKISVLNIDWTLFMPYSTPEENEELLPLIAALDVSNMFSMKMS